MSSSLANLLLLRNSAAVIRRRHHPPLRATNHTIIVASRMPADGAGNYARIQAAIDAVHLPNHLRTIIAVTPGRYCEALYIPKSENLITLATACTETTVISFDDTAKHMHHHQAARLIGTGTFGSGTMIIEEEDFSAENIKFENSARVPLWDRMFCC